ncbi:MAG: hypothetical protein ACYTF8_02335 [Planctomycetota bacterium]|jgi:hypothetical protein
MKDILDQLKSERAEVGVQTLGGELISVVRIREVGDEVVILGYSDEDKTFFVPIHAIAFVKRMQQSDVERTVHLVSGNDGCCAVHFPARDLPQK